jgi:hypothetical protein
MKIITNHHWRNFVRGYELTDAELEQFDYLDDPQLYDYFIRYRGTLTTLEDFVRPTDPVQGWHGYAPDSFFSGLLVRVSEDCDQYKIATYIE